jgi:hypothetical protein
MALWECEAQESSKNIVAPLELLGFSLKEMV